MPESPFLDSHNRIQKRRLRWEQPIDRTSRLGDCGLIGPVAQTALSARVHNLAGCNLIFWVT